MIEAKSRSELTDKTGHSGAALSRLSARPHQTEAVNAVAEELAVHDRATLVMASGAGKTATGVWSASAVIGQRRNAAIVCFFPSLALIRQTIPVWIAEQSWGENFTFQTVCSDRSVVNDDISPRDMPYPTTTEVSDVQRFLCSSGVRVVFATYHSSGVVSAALCETGIACDLAIFDEAHKTAGSPSAAFAGPLSDEVFPCRKRLFMTATPRVTNRRKRNRDGDAQVMSMDDEAAYGRVAYHLSFREAAARGIICTYKVLVSAVTTAELGAKPDDVTVDVDGVRLSLVDAASRVSVAKAVAMVDARKVITFHSTVADAGAFVGEKGIGDMLPGFEVYHVNGKQSAQDRDVAIDSFAGADRGLVSNARCLTEGVDIPAVDLVGFVDPKKSKIDIIQAIGRAMRKPMGSDKEVGYVLLPVLIDAEADIEEAMAKADLSTMWDVLSALKDEDEILAEAIRREASEGPGHGSSLRDFIDVIGDAVDIDRVRRALDISIVGELAGSFDLKFGLLQRYVEREGHARVPYEHVECGVNLGAWVGTQRLTLLQLSSPRRAQLETLPGWTWDARDAAFQDGLEVLKLYVSREGHARVPKQFVVGDFNLGKWVGKLRSRRAKLSPERIDVLESIAGWSWNTWDDAFDIGLSYLKRFISRNGHAHVPKEFIEDGYKLGQWANEKRRSCDKLTAENRAKLDAIEEWTWSESHHDSFMRGISFLNSFAAREGHARVPQKHIEDGFKLGIFVANKRKERQSMPPERRAILEQIPGWVWAVNPDRVVGEKKKRSAQTGRLDAAL